MTTPHRRQKSHRSAGYGLSQPVADPSATKRKAKSDVAAFHT